MVILYILIILLVLIIIILLKYVLSKKKLLKYDIELILFVIDMYLSYGESIDIFPSNDGKKILISKIIDLKDRLRNDTDNKKINNEK